MTASDDDYQKRDGPYPVKLRALMVAFMRSYLSFPDLEKAVKIIEEQARLLWNTYYVAELKRLQLDIKALEHTVSKSSKIMSSLLDKRTCTNIYVPVAQLYGDGKNKTILFAQWEGKDKIILVFALVVALVVLSMGTANVYTNIMGSGNPVFLDNPILAFIIAMLLPAGSIALEFISEKLETDKAKATYCRSLYALTGITLLSWTVLFALTFHGQSTGIDLDEMLEANPAASALTWIQLLAELLIGFVLCQTASEIYFKYSPRTYIRNPEYTEIEMALQEHAKHHEVLRDELTGRTGLSEEMEAAREIFVNDMVALYLNMRRRFDDSAPE